MSEEQKHPQETALQHLFEDPSTPIEKPNKSCLTGFTNVMYGYYRSYVYPLIDYEYKFKDEDWEISFESLTDMQYVGAGAFGKVYSAKLMDEIVAVKIPEDKKEIDMKYLRELRHENIVRFRGVCNNAKNPCVVMEFCQYGSLYNFLHSGTRIMINIIFKWAKEIALAMAYLHSRNIIHRDLKSPNILIADNLVVKISDFGTSRKWEKFSFVMTTRGTTYWMAPEMMLGKKCSDRVDVWSYGVVLWELLTQEVPYENLHPCAVTYGVGRETISLPLPSTFPLHLRILMNHCWHRDPKSRPSFHRITEVLNLAEEQWSWLGDELFMTMQDAWRQEVRACKKNGWHAVEREQVNVVQPQRQNRLVYRKIMREASKMYLDACSLYLRLEQREVALTEREMAYNGLINHRSVFNYRSRSARRSSSSSSGPHSLGQMTVVKLHNLNRKPRTITELASPAVINSDVTKCVADLTKNVRKIAMSQPPVRKSASATAAAVKMTPKKATADTSVTINAKTGNTETVVSANKMGGTKTGINIEGLMNGSFNSPVIKLASSYGVKSAASEKNVIKGNDVKNDVNKTVGNKIVADAPINIKKTADIAVIKPFGAKTTMKDASTIKIYGTKPGLNNTSMINVNDKAFMTDSTVAKLLGTKAAVSETLARLAEVKSALADASKAKTVSVGSTNRDQKGATAEFAKIEINGLKAPLSDSSIKFTGNNLPDILLKANAAMAESFPRGKENGTKLARDAAITMLIGNKMPGGAVKRSMMESLIKMNDAKMSAVSTSTGMSTGNKPDTLVGAITENLTNGKSVVTDIGAKSAAKDDLNGNINKILKSTSAIRDDKINDNIINEPVAV